MNLKVLPRSCERHINISWAARALNKTHTGSEIHISTKVKMMGLITTTM